MPRSIPPGDDSATAFARLASRAGSSAGAITRTAGTPSCQPSRILPIRKSVCDSPGCREGSTDPRSAKAPLQHARKGFAGNRQLRLALHQPAKLIDRQTQIGGPIAVLDRERIGTSPCVPESNPVHGASEARGNGFGSGLVPSILLGAWIGLPR